MKCKKCKQELMWINKYDNYERYGSYCVICEKWVGNDEI